VPERLSQRRFGVPFPLAFRGALSMSVTKRFAQDGIDSEEDSFLQLANPTIRTWCWANCSRRKCWTRTCGTLSPHEAISST